MADLQAGSETTAENYQVQNFPGTMAMGGLRHQGPIAWINRFLHLLETIIKSTQKWAIKGVKPF